jgi:UDP-glucose 4-epimerase
MAHELIDRGDKVVVVDSLVTGFLSAVPPNADLVVADVGDETAMLDLMRKHGVETVLHFAASTVVPESVSDPLGYYLNNTVKTRSLISAAVKAKVRHFVFSSTAAVYGTPSDGRVSETSPTTTESPYGASKLMSERILSDAAAAHEFSFAILRYFNVAGADPKGRTGQSTRLATHLIKVCAQAALGLRDGVDIFGTDYPTRDGTGVRDYIHVADLVDAHARALQELREKGGELLINCGYGEGYSVREVIAATKRIAGKDFKVREAPRRPGDPASVVANVDLLRKRLGWRPRFNDLDTMIAHALAWERHGGDCDAGRPLSRKHAQPVVGLA